MATSKKSSSKKSSSRKRSQQADVAAPPVAEQLRVTPGTVLADIDPGSTPGMEGGRSVGTAALESGVEPLSALQERLFAEGGAGGTRSVLLVIQGMDTSGKGGTMRHVVNAVDPRGVRHTAFKAPDAIEAKHDFLWRIRRALPRPGEIGVFDRSHYEDVLIARVEDLVPEATWQARYAAINRFEARTAQQGTAIIKVMLHISRDEQRERLAERLERPDKHWKFNPHDIDARLQWDDYMQAYQDALTRCSSAQAPWHIVPADHKWYARWAVQQLLIDQLGALDPQWPAADFDVETQQRRLAES